MGREPTIIRGFQPFFSEEEESCCTIGNFDGVHLGHREIIKRLVTAAEARHIPHRIVITFYPHPLVALGRVDSVRRLSTFRQRLGAFSECGVTAVRSVRFTQEVAAMSAEEFFSAVLIGQLRCKHLVLGPDTALGKNRSGTLERLQEIAATHSCTTEVVPCVEHGGAKISSRIIRELVQQGEMAGAAELLGRPYSVQGRVRRGDQRGRTIGFPTINISLSGRVEPRLGVYACIVSIEGAQYQSVANVGVRPTFGVSAPVLEAHLLDLQDADLYGKLAEVFFVARLRDEKKFAGIESLREQITLDCAAAREYLISVAIHPYGST